jgi:murein DD-endopeptidase MepM/ murein hydrolase activator NlpD
MMNNTFGLVRNKGAKPHQGWDIMADIGTPVRAITRGKIVFAKDFGEFGNTVIMEFTHNGLRLYALYAHLSALFVKEGDTVPPGYMLGLSGKTGNAKEKGIPPHLHFEILRRLTFVAGVPRPRRGNVGLLDRIDPAEILGAEALSCQHGDGSYRESERPRTSSSPAGPTPPPSPASTPTPATRAVT